MRTSPASGDTLRRPTDIGCVSLLRGIAAGRGLFVVAPLATGTLGVFDPIDSPELLAPWLEGRYGVRMRLLRRPAVGVTGGVRACLDPRITTARCIASAALRETSSRLGTSHPAAALLPPDAGWPTHAACGGSSQSGGWGEEDRSIGRHSRPSGGLPSGRGSALMRPTRRRSARAARASLCSGDREGATAADSWTPVSDLSADGSQGRR